MSVTLVDKTRYVWETIFGAVPDGKIIPVEASAYCRRNERICKQQTDRRSKVNYFVGNGGLDPPRLPKVASPLIGWPFIDTAFSKTIGSDIHLDVDLTVQPAADYAVRVFAIQYGTATSLPPRFIFVAFPKDLDLSQPLSFLLYFEHQPGQDVNRSAFQFFDPLGFDWMYYQGWSYLNYNVDTFVKPPIVDMPLLTYKIGSLGLPYQLRKAGKPYVLLLPHVNREYAPDGKLKDYQFYSAKVVAEVVTAVAMELQKNAVKPPKNIAVASFSSGCNLLAPFLQDCLAKRSDPDPDVKAFVNGVKEVFVFDASADFGDATVAAIHDWKSQMPASPPRCVRFYTQKLYGNLLKLTGGTRLSSRFDFFQSSDRSVSIAYLPFAPPDNIWTPTFKIFFPSLPAPTFDGDYVHHVIPAFFLTDAARSSLHT